MEWDEEWPPGEKWEEWEWGPVSKRSRWSWSNSRSSDDGDRETFYTATGNGRSSDTGSSWGGSCSMESGGDSWGNNESWESSGSQPSSSWVKPERSPLNVGRDSWDYRERSPLSYGRTAADKKTADRLIRQPAHVHEFATEANRSSWTSHLEHLEKIAKRDVDKSTFEIHPKFQPRENK